MRLVVITPEAMHPGEPATARAMMQRGLATLHLRKPGATADQLRAYLEELGDPWTRRVMLHAHHGLAREFAVKGVHYRESDMPPDAPPMPPPPAPGLLQSTSFHSLRRASEPSWRSSSLGGDDGGGGDGGGGRGGPIQGRLDYAFLSPVFDSISKQGYSSAGFDPAEVRAATSRPGALELVALGGVTADRLPEVAAMGFGGAAVLGGVWGAPDPVSAVEELLRRCEEV